MKHMKYKTNHVFTLPQGSITIVPERCLSQIEWAANETATTRHSSTVAFTWKKLTVLIMTYD